MTLGDIILAVIVVVVWNSFLIYKMNKENEKN
jgi:hypothetical protein